jgi:uncharacterized membrane protein YoaK (UPF0700 family)
VTVVPSALAISLAVIAGYVDALAYVGTGAFVANMTGNTVLLGIHGAYRQWLGSVRSGGAVLFFPVGVIFVRLMLIGALITGWKQSFALTAAMGLQDAAVTHFGGTSINTAFITGDLVKLGDALVNLGARSEAAQTARRLGGVWLGYVGGAMCGALSARVPVAAHDLHPWLAVAAAVLATISLALSWKRPQ